MSQQIWAKIRHKLCESHLAIFVSDSLLAVLKVNRYVLISVGKSYTVSILKDSPAHCHALTAVDYREISINPVVSKVFEHFIIDCYSAFLICSDNQSGFKTGVKLFKCNLLGSQFYRSEY